MNNAFRNIICNYGVKFIIWIDLESATIFEVFSLKIKVTVTIWPRVSANKDLKDLTTFGINCKWFAQFLIFIQLH